MMNTNLSQFMLIYLNFTSSKESRGHELYPEHLVEYTEIKYVQTLKL